MVSDFLDFLSESQYNFQFHLKIPCYLIILAILIAMIKSYQTILLLTVLLCILKELQILKVNPD